MREIKFRAWDLIKKEMFYFNKIKIETLDYEGILFYNNNELNKDASTSDIADTVYDLGREEQFELMQYTGLKDKNGKEIYEGDIIYCDSGYYKVDFENGEWQINGKGHGFGLFLSSTDFHIFRIVGNIYENPELLKGD